MTNKEFYINNQLLINQLPLFYQPKWLQIICSNNWDVVFSKDNKENIVAVFVYSLEKKGSINLIRSPKLTPYFGLYILPNNLQKKALYNFEEEHTNELINQLPQHDYCEFRTTPTHTNFFDLYQQGFIITPRITYELDLKNNLETIFENISTRTKRYIKNTSDIVVKMGIENIEDCCKLHESTFDKQKLKYQYSKAFISKIIIESDKQNFGKLFTLYNNKNQLLAFLWVAYDATNMYQLLSSYNNELAGQEAMSILTWNAISYAKTINLATYDFEGSMLPGVEQFFRKFNAERKVFYAFEKNTSKLWKLKKTILG